MRATLLIQDSELYPDGKYVSGAFADTGLTHEQFQKQLKKLIKRFMEKLDVE